MPRHGRRREAEIAPAQVPGRGDKDGVRHQGHVERPGRRGGREGYVVSSNAISGVTGRRRRALPVRVGRRAVVGARGRGRVGEFYNCSLDELMLAAELGFDGLGTNEHHQNPYGFMCNPNLFGAVLARLTRDRGFDDVAIVQLGATVSSTTPPIRIAEEYAVLDCISGGRLVAGLPLGLGADANISYGITPIEQRERWREAIDLMVKAWTRSSSPGTGSTSSCLA